MFQNSFFFAGFFDSFLWFGICISKTSVSSLCLIAGMLCSWKTLKYTLNSKKTIILNISSQTSFIIFDMLEYFVKLISFIRDHHAKFGIFYSPLSSDIGQNSDGTISDFRISGHSIIKRNYHNSRTIDDIDMTWTSN